MTTYGHDFDDDRTVDVKIDENVMFTGMLFNDDILNGLHKAGYKRPSPIQLAALPLGRCGFDLVVQAKAGTGKTLVFSLIALEKVDVKMKRTQVIIIAPTREIAVQIADIIETVGAHIKGLKVRVVIGGMPMEKDRSKLSQYQIVVGAPGRVRHLIERGIFDSKAVRLVVLDEADKLMQDSYIKDVNYIFNNAAESKQIIASSATYTPELVKFVKKYMRRGMHITPRGGSNPILVGLRQFVYVTPDHCNTFTRQNYKQEALFQLLSTTRFDQCLVFSNYVTRAEALSGMLTKQGWNATSLTSSQTQDKRLEAIALLKEHKVRVLVTTDLAARGIDASNVNLVINVEVPESPETYLHRIGRAGRFGNKGLTISIVSKGEDQRSFQKLIGQIDSDMAVYVIPAKQCADLWDEEEEFDILKAVFDDEEDSANCTAEQKNSSRLPEEESNATADESSSEDHETNSFSPRSSSSASDANQPSVATNCESSKSIAITSVEPPLSWKNKRTVNQLSDDRSLDQVSDGVSKMSIKSIDAYETAPPSPHPARLHHVHAHQYFHSTPWRHGHEHLWRTSHALRFPVPYGNFNHRNHGERPYQYNHSLPHNMNHDVWMDRLTSQIDNFVHYARSFNS